MFGTRHGVLTCEYPGRNQGDSQAFRHFDGFVLKSQFLILGDEFQNFYGAGIILKHSYKG